METTVKNGEMNVVEKGVKKTSFPRSSKKYFMKNEK